MIQDILDETKNKMTRVMPKVNNITYQCANILETCQFVVELKNKKPRKCVKR